MTLEIPDKYIKIQIKDIEIGERFREEFGDIGGFAENIRNIDLLGPITVTKNPTTGKYILVAGHRRLLACQLLGWTEIYCIFKSNLEKERIALAEWSENFYRKDFTDSEIYKATKIVLPILKEIAKERQRQAGKSYGNGKKKNNNPNNSNDDNNNNNKEIAYGNFPEAIKGNALDNLSNGLGIDRKTLGKIQKIGDAAEQNPEKYKPLFQKVDSKKISREEAVSIIKRDKEREKKESENPPVGELPPEDRLMLFNEDSTKIDRKKLPPRFHSIITDPPYGEEFLYLYEWLAWFANKELQDGDSLVFLTGHIILDKVFEIFRKYPDLKFYWILDLDHVGKSSTVWTRKFFPEWKPILYFVKGKEPAHQINRIPDKITSKKPDKRTFKWTQSMIEFEFLVKNLTIENQTVFDPFLGEEANVAKACSKLNRRCVGIENDKERFDNGVKKIKEFIHEINKNKVALGEEKEEKEKEERKNDYN